METKATIGEQLRAIGEQLGCPLATLASVKETIEECRKQHSDVSMARLMLRHGRLTSAARDYLRSEYPFVAARIKEPA